MTYQPDRPLIVQSDRSVLLEVGGPAYEAARDAISPFCELVKSPEHVHTYRVTSLSIWNAASSGMRAEQMVEALEGYSRFPVPANIKRDVQDLHGRYGRIRLEPREGEGASFCLTADDPDLITMVQSSPITKDLVQDLEGEGLPVEAQYRGEVKRALIKLGWPVEDVGGYVEGGPLAFELRENTTEDAEFRLRDYQHEAVEIFYRDGSALGGSGVVVLPCGAGKTIVGLGAMARVGRKTLVLTTNHTAVAQWRNELLAKTSLTADDVGEYTGQAKEIRPVTISTYQILTWRRRKTDPFIHFELFQKNDWGLVIYDEVHLLPAPVFRVTADLQATRRLGLTATLVREDGHEDDVFTLIGPKRYDVPWKVLERQGWIAEALCREVRVDMEPELKRHYAQAGPRQRFRLAAENPSKTGVLDELVKRHHDDKILVIGQYLNQLDRVSRHLDTPIITGRTPKDERLELYSRFRDGDLRVLVVSKVGNFAVDLPAASVIIQISGTFGSRQEEAQRLGRVLRPKEDGRRAVFYSLVSDETVEQDFGQHRQLFLTEQGYAYEILDAADLKNGKCT